MSKRTILRALILTAIIAIPLLIYFAPRVAALLYTLIATLAPLWLPAFLAAIAFPLWLSFARSQYVARIPYSIIELKPGPETPRSARAMELVFYALYYRTPVGRIEAILFGRMRMPWSFEIAAEAGLVRFFMHLPTAHRPAVEARIRAEYPDIDINEARDYSREFSFNPFSMRLAMREYTLAKPDPYPLKTYLFYEEGGGRRDVLIELLTELADVGEGEHLFISWIVRPHQRERRNLWEAPEDTLHTDAEKEISKIVGPSGDLHAVSESLQKVVAAIERALQKPSFDVGLRVLYVAEHEKFDENRYERLDTLFDRFGDAELNRFAPYDPREQIGWPLSDIFVATPLLAAGYFLDLYRRRAFFTPPYYGRAFVLNTEELATVYHLPHTTSASPFARSRRNLAPPENLPILEAV